MKIYIHVLKCQNYIYVCPYSTNHEYKSGYARSRPMYRCACFVRNKFLQLASF